MGQISELVHGHGVAEAEAVVCVDDSSVLGPDGMSEEALLQAVVGLVEGSHPGGKSQILYDGDC